MTNRILLRAHADENTVQFRTVSARMKSTRFYITYDELDRLQRDGSIISNDIHSFVQIRLDEQRDRIRFEFTWLTGHSFDRVEGSEQTVHLRWSPFREFLETCRQPDGPKDFKAISLDVHRGRPRLVFDVNRVNLKAAIDDPLVRRKLGKALMTNFQWPDADEIHLYNDFTRYSFFFREFRGGQARMCGGLILHGQEDMSKAYYGIHIKDRRVWFRNSESVGGDAIAFLRHFHGMAFPEAVRYLLAFNGYPADSPAPVPIRRTRPPPQRGRPALVLPPPNDDAGRVRAYLRGRSIAPSSDTVRVFEAPIDMMSWFTLHGHANAVALWRRTWQIIRISGGFFSAWTPTGQDARPPGDSGRSARGSAMKRRTGRRRPGRIGTIFLSSASSDSTAYCFYSTRPTKR